VKIFETFRNSFVSWPFSSHNLLVLILIEFNSTYVVQKVEGDSIHFETVVSYRFENAN